MTYDRGRAIQHVQRHQRRAANRNALVGLALILVWLIASLSGTPANPPRTDGGMTYGGMTPPAQRSAQ